MALDQSDLTALLDAFRAGEGVNLVRDAVRLVMQELIEAEATEVIGAGRYERSPARITERNGHRPRLVATQAGDIELAIPKLRKGSFLPSILKPRRRIDQALYAVVMEAYVAGVSTRSVDDLVAALGMGSGISRSEVSRICAQLDDVVGAFRVRRLDHVEFPYVFLDATYLHVRDERGQVVSRAVVVATGITGVGEREVLGVDVGDSEDETFSEALPALAAPAGPGWSAPGDLRSARWSRQGHRCVPPGRRPPALPSALRPQPARLRAPEPPADGRRRVPDDLCPARRRRRRRAVGPDATDACPEVLPSRRPHG